MTKQVKIFQSVNSNGVDKINQWLIEHPSYEILDIIPISRGQSFVWDLLIIFQSKQKKGETN